VSLVLFKKEKKRTLMVCILSDSEDSFSNLGVVLFMWMVGRTSKGIREKGAPFILV
jgi:hypothetical protein